MVENSPYTACWILTNTITKVQVYSSVMGHTVLVLESLNTSCVHDWKQHCQTLIRLKKILCWEKSLYCCACGLSTFSFVYVAFSPLGLKSDTNNTICTNINQTLHDGKNIRSIRGVIHG